MDARHIITKLRNKDLLTGQEFTWFANGLADMSVTDAQAGAFAMAVVLNGLGGDAQRANWTIAMRDSGTVLNWNLDGPILDKHSTGGVGDCVSLVLAPLLSALGVYVPMISGRGLGHTGGTLDKLEAIPGVRTGQSHENLRQILKACGCVIAGATADIAPADRRLYAIRDVTATVESMDLITASILSKKLAAGIDGLVLDVKYGSGAFMISQQDAINLANALVSTANMVGCPTTALVSDMNEPLAPALGNALEVNEAMAVLSGQKHGRLKELALELVAELIHTHNLAYSDTIQATKKRAQKCIDTGQALERFDKMVTHLGGPKDFAANWQRYLPEAPIMQEVYSPKEGYISAWDGQALGMGVVSIGGGRMIESDQINPAVGLNEIMPIGTYVSKDEPIAKIHASRMDHLQKMQKVVLNALQISKKPAKPSELILTRIN